MEPEFTRFALNRMRHRGIAVAEALECLNNATESYQYRGDTIYVFRDRREALTKVRVRGQNPPLIIDVVRVS